MRSSGYLLLLSGLAAGCASHPADSQSKKVKPKSTKVAVETVTVRDPENDRRLSRLELRVMERDAQIADLQSRLDDARQEVVRAMAKLQTIASRAEAASGIAEAEVAVRALKDQPSAPDIAQVSQLLEQSSNEYNKENYGGAVYLANQAKTLASAATGRLSGADNGAPRPGETAFAVPIGLKTTGRGNVREGPGTTFKIAFAAESGLSLTAYSYVDEWIRVADETGRSGWIFRTLVARR
jgi:hypothetical protein